MADHGRTVRVIREGEPPAELDNLVKHLATRVGCLPSLAERARVDLEEGAVFDRESDVALRPLPRAGEVVEPQARVVQPHQVKVTDHFGLETLQEGVLRVKVRVEQSPERLLLVRRRAGGGGRRAGRGGERLVERGRVKVDRDPVAVVHGPDEVLDLASAPLEQRREFVEAGEVDQLRLGSDEERDLRAVGRLEPVRLDQVRLERREEVLYSEILLNMGSRAVSEQQAGEEGKLKVARTDLLRVEVRSFPPRHMLA